MPSWFGGISNTEYAALLARLTRMERKIDQLQAGVSALVADMNHNASKVSIRLGKPSDKPQ